MNWISSGKFEVGDEESSGLRGVPKDARRTKGVMPVEVFREERKFVSENRTRLVLRLGVVKMLVLGEGGAGELAEQRLLVRRRAIGSTFTATSIESAASMAASEGA